MMLNSWIYLLELALFSLVNCQIKIPSLRTFFNLSKIFSYVFETRSVILNLPDDALNPN